MATEQGWDFNCPQYVDFSMKDSLAADDKADTWFGRCAEILGLQHLNLNSLLVIGESRWRTTMAEILTAVKIIGNNNGKITQCYHNCWLVGCS